MITPRVIPCLLLKGRGLVKTIKFKNPIYVGDPRNTVKIFNEKEVDELFILDISATVEKQNPQFDLIREIVSEAFMPVAYGGGIRNTDDAKSLFALGLEKIVVNTYAVENPAFIQESANLFGSQSVVVCIDAKRGFLGNYEIYTYSGQKGVKLNPVKFARQIEEMGAGELVVNSIDRDGTKIGYDLDLIKSVTRAVNIPVIALGGAGKVEDFREAVLEGGASAVAAGSLFVFQGKHSAVLISYPEQAVLKKIFTKKE
jgi:cyclase